MKITLDEFFLWRAELPVVINSVDMVGYQASVIIDGERHRLVLANGKPLRKKNLMAMREVLKAMPVASIILEHQSAYDEMINQPLRQVSNTLRLPVAVDHALLGTV